MLSHEDLDTPINNLIELLSMIEHRPDDMYITAMKQYIVNPLAWLLAERIKRSDNVPRAPMVRTYPDRKCTVCGEDKNIDGVSATDMLLGNMRD